MRRGLLSFREGSASPVGSWKEGWGLRERGSLTKEQLENVFWELERKAQKLSSIVGCWPCFLFQRGEGGCLGSSLPLLPHPTDHRASGMPGAEPASGKVGASLGADVLGHAENAALECLPGRGHGGRGTQGRGPAS